MTVLDRTTSATPAARTATAAGLSLTRRYLMRAGYLLMAVGLAIVKWPLLPGAPHPASP